MAGKSRRTKAKRIHYDRVEGRISAIVLAIGKTSPREAKHELMSAWRCSLSIYEGYQTEAYKRIRESLSGVDAGAVKALVAQRMLEILGSSEPSTSVRAAERLAKLFGLDEPERVQIADDTTLFERLGITVENS